MGEAKGMCTYQAYALMGVSFCSNGVVCTVGGWVVAESFEILTVAAHLSPSMSIVTQVKIVIFHL